MVRKPGKKEPRAPDPCKKLRDAINECKFISIGSDAGRVGHARVKWGHDMNDDDFEEVMVKSNAAELGRSQSGGARYDKNALPAIYQNGQYTQYPNGYRGSSSYPSLNGSKNYPLQQVNMSIDVDDLEPYLLFIYFFIIICSCKGQLSNNRGRARGALFSNK